MSYSILYRNVTLSIGTNKNGENLFIPIIESGSSNCYEWGNRRRARNWERASYLNRHSFFLTRADIEAKLDEWRRDAVETGKKSTVPYKNSSFGYLTGIAVQGKTCGSTSFGQISNFFLNPLARAVTVEQAAKLGIGITMVENPEWKDFKTIYSDKELPILLKSTEQLLAEAEKRGVTLENNSVCRKVGFTVECSDFSYSRLQQFSAKD